MANELFCLNCIASSDDRTTGNLFMQSNMGAGEQLYGGTDRCGTCKSRVKTVWQVFGLFPVFPRGSYRILDIDGATKWHSRGVPLHKRQVLTTWLVAYVCLLAGLGIWAASNYQGFVTAGVSLLIGACLASLTMDVARVLSGRLFKTEQDLSAVAMFFLGLFCFLVLWAGLGAAAVFCVWWGLGFSEWPEAARIVTAALSPLVAFIIPGSVRLHRSNWATPTPGFQVP